MQCHRAPPPLATVVPDISPALHALVHRALQKHPDARFRDVREFEREVRAIDDKGVRSVVASELELAPTLAAQAWHPRAPRSPTPVAHAAKRTGRVSMAWLVVVWMLVIGGGFAFGAWLVASR
jgi:hypothetical protein